MVETFANTSQNASILEGAQSDLDVETVTWTNILLLGFDVAAAEKRHKIPFDKTMFRRSNVKGMEVLLHFLFVKLSPKQAQKDFKAIWPVVEKTQAREFKKLAHSWLSRLEKEGHLPPNTVRLSLLQTCFGDRFYQMLRLLTVHIMLKQLDTNLAGYPVPHMPEFRNVSDSLAGAIFSTKANIKVEAKKFLEFSKESVEKQRQWKTFADKITQSYREICDETVKLNAELRVHDENADPNLFTDMAALKRAPKVDNIRHFWKEIDTIRAQNESKREFLEHILKGTDPPNRVDGRSLVQPSSSPEEQLAMSPSSGMLDLSSLIRRWNLSLSSIQKAFKGDDTVDAPPMMKVEEVNKCATVLSAHRDNHQNYLNDVNTILKKVEADSEEVSELIPKLRADAQRRNEVAESLKNDPSNPKSVFDVSRLEERSPLSQNIVSPKTSSPPSAVDELSAPRVSSFHPQRASPSPERQSRGPVSTPRVSFTPNPRNGSKSQTTTQNYPQTPSREALRTLNLVPPTPAAVVPNFDAPTPARTSLNNSSSSLHNTSLDSPSASVAATSGSLNALRERLAQSVRRVAGLGVVKSPSADIGSPSAQKTIFESSPSAEPSPHRALDFSGLTSPLSPPATRTAVVTTTSPDGHREDQHLAPPARAAEPIPSPPMFEMATPSRNQSKSPGRLSQSPLTDLLTAAGDFPLDPLSLGGSPLRTPGEPKQSPPQIAEVQPVILPVSSTTPSVGGRGMDFLADKIVDELVYDPDEEIIPSSNSATLQATHETLAALSGDNNPFEIRSQLPRSP